MENDLGRIMPREKELDLARHCCRNYATDVDLIVFRGVYRHAIVAIMPVSFATRRDAARRGAARRGEAARCAFLVNFLSAVLATQERKPRNRVIHFIIIYLNVIYSHPLEARSREFREENFSAVLLMKNPRIMDINNRYYNLSLGKKLQTRKRNLKLSKYQRRLNGE